MQNKTFTEGDTISFKVNMQTAAGLKEIELSGRITDIGNFNNGTLEVDVDGRIQTVKAKSIVGYDRDPAIVPALFSGEMVRALRARRKSVTRRLASSPLGKHHAGDLLYVREAWRVKAFLDKTTPTALAAETILHFDADGPSPAGFGKFRPGMHHPRIFSRLTLEVLNIRKERIQDITEADAIEEGIFPMIRHKSQIAAAAGIPVSAEDTITLYRDYQNIEGPGFSDPIESFRSLWNSLHGRPGEKWVDNPEVVRVEFSVIPQNVDRYTEG